MRDIDKELHEIIAPLEDGFQAVDIATIAENAAKWLIRLALDQVPGATGQEKHDWVKAQLKAAVAAGAHSLAGAILQWGGFVDLALKAADGLIDQAVEWVLEHTLDALIQWAYTDSAVRGEIPSSLPATAGA
jgi:hypothetical protein